MGKATPQNITESIVDADFLFDADQRFETEELRRVITIENIINKTGLICE